MTSDQQLDLRKECLELALIHNSATLEVTMAAQKYYDFISGKTIAPLQVIPKKKGK